MQELEDNNGLSLRTHICFPYREMATQIYPTKIETRTHFQSYLVKKLFNYWIEYLKVSCKINVQHLTYKYKYFKISFEKWGEEKKWASWIKKIYTNMWNAKPSVTNSCANWLYCSLRVFHFSFGDSSFSATLRGETTKLLGISNFFPLTFAMRNSTQEGDYKFCTLHLSAKSFRLLTS